MSKWERICKPPHRLLQESDQQVPLEGAETADSLGKSCSKCGEFKLFENFSPNKSARGGKASWCKECNAEAARKRYAANPQKYREKQKLWAAANPEYVSRARAEADARWRARATEEDYQRIRVRTKAWIAANPERARKNKRQAMRRRRARLRDAEIIPYEEDLIFERDNWVCGICMEPIDPTVDGHYAPDRRSIDHIIPISKGGGDTPDNVQAVHLRCNWKKNRF